jgi:hypothetical protein
LDFYCQNHLMILMALYWHPCMWMSLYYCETHFCEKLVWQTSYFVSFTSGAQWILKLAHQSQSNSVTLTESTDRCWIAERLLFSVWLIGQ